MRYLQKVRRMWSTRVRRSGGIVALFAVVVNSPATAEQGAGAQPTRAVQASGERATHAPAPWLDAETFTLAARYNHIEDGRDRTLQDRLQTQVQVRARFNLEPRGRYGVHIGLATGNNFRSGWNPTGIGTGQGTARLYLKHLFAAAEPWNGIELQYGSVYPARGESTEVTTFDSDAYLTAGRVSVRRPRETFFDDISVSVGYVGYLDRAFVFDRTGALSRQNYWQVLASKEVLPGLTLSTDYSAIGDDGMLRQGATWRVDRPLVDSVRGEYGVRLRGGSHQTAFAFSGEKQVANVRMQVGYANVDPVFGVLNGDPYGAGDRVFTDGSIPLPADLTATWFVQKEISPSATSRNDFRLDLVLKWSVLDTLKRVGNASGKSLR